MSAVKFKGSCVSLLVNILVAVMFLFKIFICVVMKIHELVIFFQPHFKELLLEHAPPPPAIAEYAIANLIKMGFPQRAAEGVISICSCHKEAKFGGGYTCPRCKARVCELPTECRICGLTLISSPHLARSYHHLFPVTPFNEVSASLLNNPHGRLSKTCFGCKQSLSSPGMLSKIEIREIIYLFLLSKVHLIVLAVFKCL